MARGGGGDGGAAKVAYILLLFCSVALAMALRFGVGAQLLLKLPGASEGCGDAGAAAEACISVLGVYRVSWSLFLFFMLMAVCCCLAPGFHYGFWFIKIPLWIGCTVTAFIIPNAFFDTYMQVARVAAFFFLVLQIIILVDFAHDINEAVLAWSDEADTAAGRDPYAAGACSNKWKALYLLGGFGMLAAAAGGCIAMYALLPLCPLNVFFITETWFAGLCYTLLALSARVNIGLLPPAVVFLYCVSLAYSAMRSNPDAECNPAAGAGEESLWGMLAGLALVAVTLCWAVFRAAGSARNVFRRKSSGSGGGAATAKASRKAKALETIMSSDATAMEDGVAPVVVTPPSAGAAADADEAAPPAAHVSRSVWTFHVVVALGAMYMAMLLTNYGNAGHEASADKGAESMWIKIGSQWVTAALFLWTCIAPLACPNRDFSDAHNSMM